MQALLMLWQLSEGESLMVEHWNSTPDLFLELQVVSAYRHRYDIYTSGKKICEEAAAAVQQAKSMHMKRWEGIRERRCSRHFFSISCMVSHAFAHYAAFSSLDA